MKKFNKEQTRYQVGSLEKCIFLQQSLKMDTN